MRIIFQHDVAVEKTGAKQNPKHNIEEEDCDDASEDSDDPSQEGSASEETSEDDD